MMGGRDERKGLKLYVKRVFIMDASEQLLPAYLRFVRGVVDSDDLPLNVSRELLQQNRGLEKLKSACTRRVLDLLDKLAKDEPEKFATFWTTFGATLKEGLSEDFANKERIAKLLRFASTKSEGAAQTVSLDDYIGRMTAESGFDLLPHRRRLRGREGQPATRSADGERHRSAADVRPHRRMDVELSHRIRAARNCATSPKAISIWKNWESPIPRNARKPRRRRKASSPSSRKFSAIACATCA